MGAMIKIYATFGSEGEAEKISRILLEEKIIVCANFFLIKSMYRWKGKIEGSDETAALLTTKKDNWDKVKNRIKELHSYDVPAIIRIEADADDDYLKWIFDETK